MSTGGSPPILVSIAQLPDDRRDIVRRHRLAVAVVDRDDRRRRATAEAFDRAKRYLAVGRRLAGRNAELSLERLEHGLRVDKATADIRADLDHVLADGFEVEHVVEARDRHAVRRRQVERVGDLLERLARQPAVALLRDPQRGQYRGARFRVLPGDLANFLDHRSVSPITASSEPTIATRSAMSASCMHVAVASSAANEGARKCTRHGFGPPSETR